MCFYTPTLLQENQWGVILIHMGRREIIRLIYLYLFSTVGLVLALVGAVRLTDMALKAFIFTRADISIRYPEYPRSVYPYPQPPVEPKAGNTTSTEPSPAEMEEYKKKQEIAEREEQRSRRERTAAESLAMIIIGTPLFFYHWRTIQKESVLRREGEK